MECAPEWAQRRFGLNSMTYFSENWMSSKFLMDHGELHYYKEDRGMNHYVIDISHNLLNLTPLSSTTNWVTFH